MASVEALFQISVEALVREVPTRYWLALGILVLGLLLAYLVGLVNKRLLRRAGIPEAIEGTSFERTVRDFGTSTVAILAKLGTYFIIGLTVMVALTAARIQYTTLFWNHVAAFLPQLFVAVFILIVGIVVGDKVELLVSERLRGIKIPQIGIIPLLAKYTVFYIAGLIALSQLGVATLALIVLLAAYAFGFILLGAFAFKDMLASAAAGIYLLLDQPYGIGDEVQIGDNKGIVQEVDIFVTHIESEGQEYIIPNRLVFRQGIVRVR